MSSFLSHLRSFLHPDDAARAFADEARHVAAAATPTILDPRFRADMAEVLSDPGPRVDLGTAYHDDSLRAALRVADLVGQGAGLVLGGSGSGKTRVCLGMIRDLLRWNATAPHALGLAVLDHKSELVALAKDVIADVTRELPLNSADALINRVAVFNPFSTSTLVPFQILAPEPGVPAEVQAYEVTTLLNRMGGAALGVKQDAYTYHLMLLGIVSGRTLPGLAALLGEPEALVRAARECSRLDVRAYFGRDESRIGNASLEGVRARLHRLLRLPTTRRMLDAKSGPLSFRTLLHSMILLLDVGSPPLGCEDIGRFWAELLTLKLTRAIFDRSPEEAVRPVIVFVDEWQEGLAAGGDVAEQYARTLSMARAKGVSLWLVSQSLAGAAQVSAALPRIVATNTAIHMLFRASPEDASAMRHLLPITLRRSRPRPLPWEERSKSPFLSAAEETQALLAEIPQLEQRVFYLWNRRRPYAAHLVRAGDVSPVGLRALDAERAGRIEQGALAVAMPERETDACDVPESIFRPVAPASLPLFAAPSRRPRTRGHGE